MNKFVFEEWSTVVQVITNSVTAIAVAAIAVIAVLFWRTGSLTVGSAGVPTAIANNGNTAPTQPAPGDNGAPVKVSVDDDAVLGDKNAKVTLIDFSDYECPFCKRHFTDTYPQLKKDFIDTGKVKMVYRDLPLSFHQNAPKEAQAAECARKQGGDSVYYKYHDQIFTKTTSNGTGLALDQLPVIAKDIGLNVTKFQTCLDSGETKAEVDKDLADAAKYGASGTPTFFIGKSTSTGEIDAVKLVGAQPYAAFKTIIDQELSK
ncbi:MAG: DsbA family protein [Candidatus Woesebacteria bacterium]